MPLSDKSVQEFKDIFKKEYGKELSDSEARESAERLMGFMGILYDQAVIEARRTKRLEKEPEGFALKEHEGPYNCILCHQSISGSNAWWDLNGLKCLDCQRNIKEDVIPGEICTKDELWIKDWQLHSDFGVHPATRGKLKREGMLKGRELKNEKGQVYYTIYLVSENQEFLKKYPRKDKKTRETIVGKDGRPIEL